MQTACPALIVIWGLFGSTTFFHIISQMAQLSGKKGNKLKMCGFISSTMFV